MPRRPPKLPPLLADFEPKGAVAQAYGVYRASDGFSERALFVIDAEGYVSVIVNWQVMMDHGKYTGALSGRVIWSA